MSDVLFDQTINVKTSGVSKLALDQVVARLRATGRVRWKGKLVTKEAVVNALWLWVGDMDSAQVEEAMTRYVPRLEAILKGEPLSNGDALGDQAAQDQNGPRRPRKGQTG